MTLRRIPQLALFMALAISLPAGATLPTVPAATAAAAPASSFGAAGVLQAAFGLMMVLALIFACAWAARRFGLQQHRANGVIKVVSGAMVGQRERVVVVEIGKSWLVLGVTPGQVRALHAMPAEELPPADATPFAAASAASAANAFAQKLRESLGRRRRPD
jgi:flagellar protein FliO/FliZ